MDIRAEQDFTIDGIKSWIHCLVTPSPKPSKSGKISYHYHDYIELLYGLEDGATVWINGDGYPFEEGDLFLINSREPHTVTAPNKASHICVKFLPHILYAEEQALMEFKYVIPFLSENRHQKRFAAEELGEVHVGDLMREIIGEWEGKEIGYEMVIRAAILRLFSGILRYWHNESYGVSGLPMPDVVKNALAYLDVHYATATEQEVADACAISYNHFSRLFKKALGRSFSDYLTHLRIREAEKRLISTDRSVTEIAMDVGFSSSSHFIARFREHRQITPRQFRIKARSGLNP